MASAVRFSLLILAVLGLSWGSPVVAQESRSLSLSGEWFFALDPLEAGVEQRWHSPDPQTIGSGWDRVTVPHAWPTDPRYDYTGTAWYRRTFTVPAEWTGQHLRLAFGAVFQRSFVWVNGHPVGEHEGGYTPFTLDVTAHLRPGEENTVALAVSNEWDLSTIPGARPGGSPSHQVYPWWNYGGIVRDVELLASPHLFVEKQKIVADPDLRRGTADLDVIVWVANAGDQPRRANVGLEVRRDGSETTLDDWRRNSRLRSSVEVPPRSVQPVRIRSSLSRTQVALWNVDAPNLYEMRASVWEGASPGEASHVLPANFGIRKVELRDAQLLLNGEPIRMGGANRPSDHPRYGLVEPDEVVNADMRMMKEAGMDFSRINHHASPVNLLKWGDRNGMLHIPEAGNWQLAPDQMDDPVIRDRFRQQMREMVERDWNHPSVIGWSVGNEYPIDSPAGVRWTRDMADFVRSLDDSRFITVVALGSALAPTELAPADRSFHYVDAISVNLYSLGFGEGLERLHATWPEKPVLITEFGIRADQATPERQEEYLRDFMRQIRQHPYVVNASVWTFNDYRSRYPGTNPDGTRHWGVVDFERRPRLLYHLLREEFAPATISVEATRVAAGAVRSRVRVTGRDDFPRFTLREYTARVQLLDGSDRVLHEETKPLGELRPGQSRDLTFDAPGPNATGAARVLVEIIRPTGFSAAVHTHALDAAIP
jgi:beta-glucuronidase